MQNEPTDDPPKPGGEATTPEAQTSEPIAGATPIDDQGHATGAISGKARDFDQKIMLGSGLSPTGQIRMCAMLLASAISRAIVAKSMKAPVHRMERKRIIETALHEIKVELQKRFTRGVGREPPIP